MRADVVTGGAGDFQNIGDVELALGVVGIQLGQGVAQNSAVESENAGVDLIDAQLLGRSVLLLDDGLDGTVRVTHDAAVTGWVIQLHRQNGDCVTGGHVGVVKPADGFRTQQRNVAVGDDDGAGEVGEWGKAALYRVACAVLLLLNGLCDLAAELCSNSLDGRGDLVALVTDHSNEVLGVKTSCSV